MFIEHRYGFQLHLGYDYETGKGVSAESLAQQCHLPKLITLVQGYKFPSPFSDEWCFADGESYIGYRGEFEHPSGKRIQLDFSPRLLFHLSRPLRYADKSSLPLLYATEPGDWPWDAEPKYGKPPKLEPPAPRLARLCIRRIDAKAPVEPADESLAPPQKVQKCDAGVSSGMDDNFTALSRKS